MHVNCDPLWNCELKLTKNEPSSKIVDSVVVVDEIVSNTNMNDMAVKDDHNVDEKNEIKNENWLVAARKNLKKIEQNVNTPVSRKNRKKKIHKIETSTIGSSGKKSKVGERKHSNVNEIRTLWERKLNVNGKESSKTPIKEKPQIGCHKVKKIIAELDPRSDLIRSNSHKNSVSRSESLIDRWVMKSQRVGIQTKQIEVGRDEKGDKVKVLSSDGT